MKILDAHRSGLHVLLVVVAITSYGATTFAFGQGNSTRGATAFQACMACHSTKAGEQLTGPSLANIWQHKAGTVAGFHRYSDAMKHADIVWTDATLDQWLTDPDKLIPGTSMTFQGLRASNTRKDVIAYRARVAGWSSSPDQETAACFVPMARSNARRCKLRPARAASADVHALTAEARRASAKLLLLIGE